jgi:hypothetical protein
MDNLYMFVSLTTLLLTTACSTVSPLAGKKVNPEQKQECVDACKRLQMKMGAFVFFSGRTGCVCEEAASTNHQSSAAVSGGGLLAMIEEEEAAAQQQQKSK